MLPLVAARREHTRGVPLCTSVREGVFPETELPSLRSSRKLKGLRGYEKGLGGLAVGSQPRTLEKQVFFLTGLLLSLPGFAADLLGFAAGPLGRCCRGSVADLLLL